MKKKRFYKNVKRNTKWTEEEKGYPIDFADKYASDEGIYSDKFDYMRPKIKKKRKHKAKARTLLKRLGISVLCFAIICVGYTCMDVFMLRNGMPEMSAATNTEDQNAINTVKMNLHCAYEDSISMDGSVILDSVVENITAGAYNSVAIDIKRNDGTIGYRSALATVDAYSAMAFTASDLRESTARLTEQDILTVGIVYCYLDNLVPRQERSVAVLDSNGIPYEDSHGNTYLNPNSETVYKYIKDIISEASEMGVTVFVLRGTDIPDSAGTGFADGFDRLASRLYEDIGTNIKLLEGVDVDIDDSLVKAVTDPDNENEEEETTESENSGDSGEESTQETTTLAPAKERILSLFDEDLGTDKIYIVNADDSTGEIKKILEEGGIESFILQAE